MSVLLMQERGKTVKDPGVTVRNMVRERKTRRQAEVGESGTVQQDTKFTQVCSLIRQYRFTIVLFLI